jgi:hypothetical protein
MQPKKGTKPFLELLAARAAAESPVTLEGRRLILFLDTAGSPGRYFRLRHRCQETAVDVASWLRNLAGC